MACCGKCRGARLPEFEQCGCPSQCSHCQLLLVSQTSEALADLLAEEQADECEINRALDDD